MAQCGKNYGKDQQHQQDNPFEYRNDKGEVYVIDVAEDSTGDDDNGCSDSGIDSDKAPTIQIDVPIPPSHSVGSDKSGFAFTNGDDLYVYTSYRAILKQDKIILNFLHDDGSNENVTDYELIVESKLYNFMIFYIPDMYIDSAKEGPTIVGIDTGGFYRHRAGVVYTKSNVIPCFDPVDGDDIRIIFPEGLKSLGKACVGLDCSHKIIEIKTENLITLIPLCDWKKTTYPSVTKAENFETSTPIYTPLTKAKTIHISNAGNEFLL